jgi:hypothetical protein
MCGAVSWWSFSWLEHWLDTLLEPGVVPYPELNTLYPLRELRPHYTMFFSAWLNSSVEREIEPSFVTFTDKEGRAKFLWTGTIQYLGKHLRILERIFSKLNKGDSLRPLNKLVQ